jgi:membrane fusion protein, heavy metal efflux system
MQRLLLSVVCLLLFGCSDTVNKDKAANSDLEPLAYTLYTERTELFVEFKPLTVGQPSKFAAHFTKLGDLFTPLMEGKITVRLIQDGQQISQTTDTPSNPGIFRLALQPTTAGVGKLEFEIVTKDYTDRIIIDSVVIYPDLKTAKASQPEEVPNATEISYLKERYPYDGPDHVCAGGRSYYCCKVGRNSPFQQPRQRAGCKSAGRANLVHAFRGWHCQ